MSLRSRVSPYAHRALDRGLRRRGERRFLDEFAQAQQCGSVQVNIGSGGKPLDGWINCDLAWQAKAYLDATRTWPVPAGSVDVVYADNVIEHITLPDGRLVFANAWTAMRPGGVFRLATPDVEAVARQYLENGELARAGMERNRERGRHFDHPVQLIQQVFVGAKHYLGFCYDYASLAAEMEKEGFAVTRVRAGESDHPALKGLEQRMHPAEEATALIVEGTKILDMDMLGSS